MLDCSSVKKISQISQMSRVEKKSYCQLTNNANKQQSLTLPYKVV